MALFASSNTSGTSLNTTTGIKNGDYADYKLTYNTGAQAFIGTCRISYSNVTATTMTMIFSITLNGQTTTQSMDIVLRGNTWEMKDPNDSDSTFELIGKERIQTALGPKECTHTRSTTSTFVEDDWFTSPGCYLKSIVAYTNGIEMTMEITRTNIDV